MQRRAAVWRCGDVGGPRVQSCHWLVVFQLFQGVMTVCLMIVMCCQAMHAVLHSCNATLCYVLWAAIAAFAPDLRPTRCAGGKHCELVLAP